ncbi:hypothetical protein Leryth_026943 [Lithospermum erythrorhizon]|nr:hypothetical protein Leryth_026943 [Lithospermum erythrorhizon]
MRIYFIILYTFKLFSLHLKIHYAFLFITTVFRIYHKQLLINTLHFNAIEFYCHYQVL